MYGLRMTRIAQRMISPRGRSASAQVRRTRPRIEALEARLVLSSSGNNLYLQTNLVSDIQGMAQAFDPNLKDPWGLSFSTGSPFWVSDQASNVNGSSVTTPLQCRCNDGRSERCSGFFWNSESRRGSPRRRDQWADGPGEHEVRRGSPQARPIFRSNGKEASFIFANMDGSISAWNGGPQCDHHGLRRGCLLHGAGDRERPDRVPSFIYAADQNSGNVYVFNSQWKMIGKLTDPNGLPAGFNAFNVQNLNGLLYVTYTNQSIPSGGIVDMFKPDGTFVGRLINDPTGKWLDNPWGLTIAPQSFGKFGGDLLVGNNGGNNWINAFDPMNGDFKGVLTLASGQPFSENNLWALSFGNGGSGGLANTLYFTAGPGGTDGLFGSLQAIPSLSAKAPIVPNLPNGAFQTLTTVPANGDLNPYGVAFVPPGFPSGGTLSPGDILVSNFNNSCQPTGDRHDDRRHHARTVASRLFFQGPSTPGQLGLTTALGVLKRGFVIVGNVPATYDSHGQPGVRRPGIPHDPRSQRQRRHHAERSQAPRRPLGPDRSTTRGARPRCLSPTC